MTHHDAAPPAPGSLGFALRKAQAAVAADFADRFDAEDIRPGQFSAIALLRQSPGIRQSQLSEALGIQRSNLVPLLHELEQRGLLERRAVAGDRRAGAWHLTPAGDAALDRLAALAVAHERRFAARLGPGGHAALLGLLARLADPAFDAG